MDKIDDSAGEHEAFILNLPNEILTTILEIASSKWPFSGADCECEKFDNEAVLKALKSVNRQVRSLVLPLLYRNLRLEVNTVDLKPISAINRASSYGWKTTSAIKRDSRAISIKFCNLGILPYLDDNLKNIDLLSSFKRVKCLHLDVSMPVAWKEPYDLWRVLPKIVSAMPNIRHIHLSGFYDTPYLQHLSKINLNIQKLDIESEFESGGIVNLLPPEKHGTANFTELQYSGRGESTSEFAELLRWPKMLTQCRVSFKTDDSGSGVEKLQALLLIHLDTLTTLDIGFLRDGPQLFKASLFPNLRFLAISWYHVDLGRQFSSVDADALLAPKLQTFVWNVIKVCRFHWWTCICPRDTSFGEKEEKWLRSLARAAIQRKAKLKTIEIIFDPYLAESLYLAGDIYAWDRIDSIHNEVRWHGMALTYNMPLIQKQIGLWNVTPGAVKQNNNYPA